MFTTIRKHQRWLMVLIAFLTIIAFAFLYNTTEMDRVGSNIVARIYGRDVMTVDIERAVRVYQLALALGQFDLVRDLSGQAQTEDEAANNFIWNLMVLQHEARQLGVEPGDAAVVERIKALPVFQTDGKFDPVKYSGFMQEQLAPRGFTERQLEDVIKDSLRLEELKSLVESPAILLPGELEPALQRVAPADVEVLRFNAASVAAGVEVDDAELRKAFEGAQTTLQAPEKRSIRYAALVLSPEEKELKDKPRVDAMQKLATKTGDLAQALGEGTGLGAAAAALGLEVRATPFFGPDGSTEGALADLDGEVVPAAAAVAFRLPSVPGNFEIVELGQDGYAVIEVAEVQPARPLTFEEARADLRDGLAGRKREAAVREAAEKAIAGIREKMAAGTSFADAAKAAKVKTETLKGITVFAGEATAEQRQVAMAVMEQPDGTLGDFRPGPDGGFAAYVVERRQPDAGTLAEQRPRMEQGLLQGKEMLLFAQWLAAAREASGLQLLRPMM
ncbi:MAG: SurA N-terminal domain-containing protein [Chthoniobacterales bacterium]